MLEEGSKTCGRAYRLLADAAVVALLARAKAHPSSPDAEACAGHLVRLLEARVEVPGEVGRDRRLLRGDARDAVSQWCEAAAKVGAAAALHERLQQLLAEG